MQNINNQARGTKGGTSRNHEAPQRSEVVPILQKVLVIEAADCLQYREKAVTNPVSAESIMVNSRLAVTLVRLDGEILYMSPVARELLDRARSGEKRLQAFLTVPAEWEEIVQRAGRGEIIQDEHVLLETIHGDVDLCNLTVLPQRGRDGHVESLLCVWAARQNVLAAGNGGQGLSDYAKELEEVLEHRTYQHLLAAEQNEFAQQVLSLLSVGLVILSREGEVLYRNTAMCDDFGLRPAEYLQPNIRHFMTPEVVQSFHEVVENGTRAHHATRDPGGFAVLVDVLPVVRAGVVQRVVMQFTRPVSDTES
jgi:PAS domain-containing protein